MSNAVRGHGGRGKPGQGQHDEHQNQMSGQPMFAMPTVNQGNFHQIPISQLPPPQQQQQQQPQYGNQFVPQYQQHQQPQPTQQYYAQPPPVHKPPPAQQQQPQQLHQQQYTQGYSAFRAYEHQPPQQMYQHQPPFIPNYGGQQQQYHQETVNFSNQPPPQQSQELKQRKRVVLEIVDPNTKAKIEQPPRSTPAPVASSAVPTAPAPPAQNIEEKKLASSREMLSKVKQELKDDDEQAKSPVPHTATAPVVLTIPQNFNQPPPTIYRKQETPLYILPQQEQLPKPQVEQSQEQTPQPTTPTTTKPENHESLIPDSNLTPVSSPSVVDQSSKTSPATDVDSPLSAAFPEAVERVAEKPLEEIAKDRGAREAAEIKKRNSKGSSSQKRAPPAELFQSKVCDKVRALINKITPTSKESLTEEFITYNVSFNDEQLGQVVDNILDKAKNPKFSSRCAELCKAQVDHEIKLSNGKSAFRDKLLMRIQAEYQDRSEFDEERMAVIEKEEDPAKRELLKIEERQKFRRRRFGVMTFIDHLYRNHLLAGPLTKEFVSDDSRNENDVIRTVRTILDATNESNQDDKIIEFVSLNLNDEKNICDVVELIFKKAVEKPESCHHYANMCKAQTDRDLFHFKKDSQFGIEVIERAQKTFGSSSETPAFLDFLAHLYRTHLIETRVVQNCIFFHLSSILSLRRDDVREEEVECGLRLIEKAGPFLDTFDDSSIDFLNEWFVNLEAAMPFFSERIRLKVMDVAELRSNKWRPIGTSHCHVMPERPIS